MRRKVDAGLLFYMQKSGIQKELRLSVPVLAESMHEEES
nr:MAG TPA: hypothetical protein [Caudoviricetes sp.]